MCRFFTCLSLTAWLLISTVSHALGQMAAPEAKTFSGKIVGSDGNVVPFASVKLSGKQFTKGLAANEQGYFQLADLPLGEYVVEISSVGYAHFNQVIQVDRLPFTASFTLQVLVVSLKDVVVTATRTDKPLADLPIPVTVIDKDMIQSMGSMRLNEVLLEQTGLAMVSDHGLGVQIQGMNPDYTLILVDGEPLIGRTAGTFDLTRLTVNNIKRIEIVKGPSSSLYGSEALAGVINIITENPPDPVYGSVRSRYGSNQTLDLSADAGINQDKWGLYVFANRFATNGYDLMPETLAPTVPEFFNHTLTSRFNYRFSEKLSFNTSGRFFRESQENRYLLGVVNPREINQQGTETDWSVNNTLNWSLSSRVKIQGRYYHTAYSTLLTDRFAEDGTRYDESRFSQQFRRPEVQVDIQTKPGHVFTTGAGATFENVDATRYRERQFFQTLYGFVQYDMAVGRKIHIITGGRLDTHSAFTGQFSPKLSGMYQVNDWLKIKATAAAGFKAPDFRQLYLVFTNPAIGYSVFGSEEVQRGVAELEARGLIAFKDDALIARAAEGLNPERSLAFNLGFDFKPKPWLSGEINLYRNNLRDMIDTRAVLRKTEAANFQQGFTYFNLDRVRTQGLEANVVVKPFKHFQVMAGYQLLDAVDLQDLERIDQGLVFYRDPQTLVTRRVDRASYGGLFNRSRHMGNLKFFYDIPAWHAQVNLRGIYRGTYGLTDFNGNGIYDRGDPNEEVKGYAIWNLAANKTWKSLTVQAGIDNLLGFTDPMNIPVFPGRVFFASLHFAFGKSFVP